MFWKIIIISFISFLYLGAYEVPKVEIAKDDRPEIALFNAKSVIIDNKKSYKVEWKTINATMVQLSYIGKVNLSGSITITEEEYNRGAITLTASSQKSSHSDSKTINKQKSSEPVVILKDKEEKTQYYHVVPTYHRGLGKPYRRRYR